MMPDFSFLHVLIFVKLFLESWPLKGIVHPKMKILSLITHLHVVPKLEDLHSSLEHKYKYF